MKEGKSKIRMSGNSAAIFIPSKVWNDSANGFKLEKVWIVIDLDKIIITKIKEKEQKEQAPAPEETNNEKNKQT